MIHTEAWYRSHLNGVVASFAAELERTFKSGDLVKYQALLERSGKADELRETANDLVDQTLPSPIYHEQDFKIGSPTTPDIKWREERRASDVLKIERFKDTFVVKGRLKLVLGMLVGEEVADEEDAGHIQPPINTKAWNEFFERTVREEWRTVQPGVHLLRVKLVSLQAVAPYEDDAAAFEHGHDDFEIAPGEWYPRIWTVELNLQWQVRLSLEDVGLST